MPSTGRRALPQASTPLFLIDESLDWNVSRALKLVEYNTTSVLEAFEQRSGVSDPEIIAWCKDHDATWVHADDSARKEHRKELLVSQIRFLWVYRPGGVMGSKDQLRLLSYILPDLLERYANQPRRRHYKASAHGQATRKRIRLEPVDLA